MSTYSLLYNATDGNFTTGTNQSITVTSTSITASAVSFTLPATNFSNGYYTLMWVPPASLPIYSVIFNAEKKDAGVAVSWRLDGGNQSRQLILEKSEKGQPFREINFQTQDTIGGSIFTGNYNDLSPCNGINAYRLKLVDANGTFEFSPTRLVDFSGTSISVLAAYPNPVSGTLRIQLKGAGATKSNFVILAGNGAMVYSGTLNPNRIFTVNTSSWANGIYYLYCKTGSATSVFKQLIKR